MKRSLAYCFVVPGLLALGGCVTGVSISDQDRQQMVVPRLSVNAEEPEIDRRKPEWLEEYCLEAVTQAAWVPVPFGRQRGPLMTLEPVYGPERYQNYRKVETCNSDFYLLPIVEEAFGAMGLEHGYREEVWDEFEERVSASVSAYLARDGWTVRENGGAEGEPDLSLMRDRKRERLKEYLDVIFTNDEEVIFELLVVDLAGGWR